MENNKLNSIDGVFSLGRLITGKKLVVLYAGAIFPIFMIAIIIGVIITAQHHLMSITKNIIIALTCASILVLFYASIFIVVLIKNNKIIKKTQIYLQDAYEIYVKVRRVDIENYNYKPYQCEIIYEVNGVEHKKISPKGDWLWGNNKYLLKHCGSKVKALYSQQYDQILLLKAK